MSQSVLKQLHKVHQLKQGLLFFGLVELGLSYWIGSLALNSGSLGQWTLSIILLLGAVHNFGRLVAKLIRKK